ncbi:MAG: L-glutamate gamma-semialdehyde dehydrogenase [Saprospirales bacterium]|nr:MAG: L-glutamate gamma-semialdehyde dehydrogenase [Saprospirales bacterium]
MSNAIYTPPFAFNEPVLDHAPDSTEREALKNALAEAKKNPKDIPLYIGGEKVYTDQKVSMHPPYDRSINLGTYNKGDETHVRQAIDCALAAKKDWEEMPWEERAAIFLKAADLLSGPYRAKMNAATMLAQSKNIYQAEIDCICELADFWRFNVQFMTEIYAEQPESSSGVWNRTEHRPLEGFVFAITPFNFTAIAGNLPSAPAMMGNTVVWKAAESQIYSASVIMEILEEAGLPAGVINLVHVSGPVAGDIIFSHRDFAGIHFTGSTGVFKNIWRTIANNLDTLRTFPRIVGETGGKDFILAHPSADVKALVTAMSRGAFEFQGQKCSAASRAYIPSSIWSEVKKLFLNDLKSFKMGSPEDFGNFINAVIDEKAFDKITSYIDQAKKDSDAEVIAGGNYNKSKGFFIEPTVILTTNPSYTTICEEIFGPVLTIFVYEDADFDQVLQLVDGTSPYALTGAVFAKDRSVIHQATKALRHSAGNFYINDKPTGAVVGQQPFGGARGSGTNDKAGSVLNLHRWVSQRTIKETFNPPKDYRYPFLSE